MSRGVWPLGEISIRQSQNGQTCGGEKGWARHRFYRVKQFARIFSKADMGRLCKLCSEGNSLSWSHIPTILKVKSEKERWDLLGLAAQNDWSVGNLELEVDGRYPQERKYGGGKPKTAADAEGLVQQIVRTSETWLRFDDQLRIDGDEGAYRGEVPAALRDSLRAVRAAMQHLNEAAESVELPPSRAKRKKK